MQNMPIMNCHNANMYNALVYMLHMGYPCNPNSNPVKKLSTLLWHNWTVTQSNPANPNHVNKGLSVLWHNWTVT